MAGFSLSTKAALQDGFSFDKLIQRRTALSRVRSSRDPPTVCHPERNRGICSLLAPQTIFAESREPDSSSVGMIGISPLFSRVSQFALRFHCRLFQGNRARSEARIGVALRCRD